MSDYAVKVPREIAPSVIIALRDSVRLLSATGAPKEHTEAAQRLANELEKQFVGDPKTATTITQVKPS